MSTRTVGVGRKNITSMVLPIRAILLVGFVFQQQENVLGFGIRAGGCPGGESAVSGSHVLPEKNPTTGGLSSPAAGLTVSLDGVPLTATGTDDAAPVGAVASVTVDEPHTLELSVASGSGLFTGVLFRLEQDGRELTVANMLPDPNDPNVQDAAACRSPVVGVCHNSGSPKSTAKASLFLDGETSLPPTIVSLDVTVVISNNVTSSIHYYDRYELDPVALNLPEVTTSPPGPTPPPGETCSLCPPGVPLVNEDFQFPDSEGTTCADFATLAPEVQDAETCLLIQEAASPVCCEGLANCTMCAGDAAPGNPDARVPYQEIDYTCDMLRLFVYYGYDPAAAADSETCVTLPALELVTGLNGHGYCGCPESAGAESNLCSPTLCPMDGPFNADVFVPAANVTCGTLEASLPWLTTTEACSVALDDAAAAGCCLPAGTTLPPAPPATTETCSLCDGNNMTNPDASFGPVAGGATCLNIQVAADAGDIDADLCPFFQFLARRDGTCGCTGTFTPAPDACSLCDGDAERLINANESFDPDIDLTCRDFFELATYYRSVDDECGTLDVAPACCAGVANCTFCEADAVPTGDPNAVIPYSNGTTCRQLRFRAYFAYDPVDGGCASERNDAGINAAAYCGCPEAAGSPPAVDPPVCDAGSLCPPGTTVDGAIFLEAANATCGDLVAVAPYVVDPSLCQRSADDAREGGCCVDAAAETVTPNATNTATTAPAQGPTTTTAAPVAETPASTNTATTAPAQSPTATTAAPVAETPASTAAPGAPGTTPSPTDTDNERADANTESTRSTPSSGAAAAAAAGGGWSTLRGDTSIGQLVARVALVAVALLL